MSGTGKFQEESDWLESFWERIGDSDYDDSVQVDDIVYFTRIIGNDVDWPELADVYAVIMYEDSQGFVYGEEYTTIEDYTAAFKELEELAGADSEEDEDDDETGIEEGR